MLGQQEQTSVFSTYVEVILNKFNFISYKSGILHVCGGDPIMNLFLEVELLYSPRMWR